MYMYGRVERESGQLITAQSRGCSYSINYRGWCAIGVRIIDIVAALFTVASEFIDRQRAGRLAGWLAGWSVGWLGGSLAGWLGCSRHCSVPPPSSPSPFRRLRLQGYRVFSFSISLSLSPSFASFRETLALTTALLSRPNQFPSNIFLLFQLLFNSCKAREGNRGGILIYIYITSLLFFLPPCTLFFFFFFLWHSREGRIWSGTKSKRGEKGRGENFSARGTPPSFLFDLVLASLFKLRNSCCIFARLPFDPRWSRYNEGQVFLPGTFSSLLFLFLFPPFPFARGTGTPRLFPFLSSSFLALRVLRRNEEERTERERERGFLGLFLGTRNTMDRFRERPRGLNVNNGITARLEDYPRWLSPIAQRVTPDKRS